ncbi:hypothetical protein J2Z34_000122 [Youngiibacter multivorans]|jgi:hypothetical protein|uniref:Holin-like toxin n=1 Tax=Youngiibacter multivorans TaxID=937251 RepID=A0ABS4FZE6_9CLOT|nr:hypothetical protein [Youngiibacter multivorans]
MRLKLVTSNHKINIVVCLNDIYLRKEISSMGILGTVLVVVLVIWLVQRIM